MHVHGKGHLCPERFGLQDLVHGIRRQGDDQRLQSVQPGQDLADQAQCRTAELLHQAGEQQGRWPITQLLMERLRGAPREAVVMDRGDQSLLEVHAVINATTLSRQLLDIWMSEGSTGG